MAESIPDPNDGPDENDQAYEDLPESVEPVELIETDEPPTGEPHPGE